MAVKLHRSIGKTQSIAKEMNGLCATWHLRGKVAPLALAPAVHFFSVLFSSAFRFPKSNPDKVFALFTTVLESDMRVMLYHAGNSIDALIAEEHRISLNMGISHDDISSYHLTVQLHEAVLYVAQS